MNVQFQKWLEKMRSFQSNLIDYLNDEKDFEAITESIRDFQKYVNIREMNYIIQLIVEISNNYHRTPDFFNKIFKILNLMKSEIEENYTNSEIFNLFKSNKRILLFFIEKSTLKIDHSIFNHISENKYWNMQYIQFFLPETKKHISQDLYSEIKNDIKDDIRDIKSYKAKRRIGENDHYICELIRNDSIDDFVIYMNKTNLSVNSTIEKSIFETNLFLMNSNPSLIEYAAFFGSFQIFKYLQLNDANLRPSLWLYAIHGKKPEIIHILEELHIEPSDKCFYECFVEAIKCHWNDMALYVQDNLLTNYQNNFDDYHIFFKYHNYLFLNESSPLKMLYYFVEYHYNFLVLQIMKMNFTDINEMIIHNNIFTNQVYL